MLKFCLPVGTEIIFEFHWTLKFQKHGAWEKLIIIAGGESHKYSIDGW